MNCPGCGHEAQSEVYDGHYTPRVELDVCHHCNSLWFDGHESLALTPGATVKLFHSMYERRESARQPHHEVKACPRCNGVLKETFDKRHTTAFSYFRCDAHGRFITFFQFLREKGFVRQASVAELEALKAKVKTVQCSSCGAPVPLSETSHCQHCQTPICFLGGEKLEGTLRELAEKEDKRQRLDPAVSARLVMDQLSVARFYREIEREERGFGRGTDLMSIGLRALFSKLL